MALLPGARIGAYEIKSTLGHGGMGVVFRAHDTKLQRDVALKLLPEQLTHDADRLSRFQREAQILASLNHPNIAQIYGFEESSNRRCIVMELVEGETLQDVLNRGPLAWNEAVPLATQIAEALDAAHGKGLVHRDVKPANIKITPDRKLKLLDFGLAKMVETDRRESSLSDSPTIANPTTLGVILGTAAYMSPEQARGSEIDERTDIWSFGCVLFEMLSGKAVFAASNVSDTISRILRDEPMWDDLPHDIPEGLYRLLRRCLQKDANRRLRSAHDAWLDLDELKAPLSSGSAVIQKRTQLIPLLALVLLGAILITGLIRFWPNNEDPPVPIRLSMVPPPGLRFETAPYISPDGRHVAFLAEGGLWIRNLDSEEARKLSDARMTAATSTIFWSPDSRSIGFIADGKLRKIDISGGPAQEMANASSGRGGSWAADGTILFVPNPRTVVHRITPSGGKPEPITQLDASRQEFEHAFPVFLPDGRRFLYLARSSQPENSGIMLASVDSKAATPVVASRTRAVYAPPGFLLFLRENALLAQRFDLAAGRVAGDPSLVVEGVAHAPSSGNAYFDVSNTGLLAYRSGSSVDDRQLTWINRNGEIAGTVGEPGPFLSFRIAPDQRKISLDRADPLTGLRDIWIMDVSRGVPTRLTINETQESGSTWSPDSSRVLYYSNRNGPQNFYIRTADGSGDEQQVFHSDVPTKMPMDWSPDGRYLMFEEAKPKVGRDLMVLPLFGDRKPFPFAAGPFDQGQGRFSPDGRWVAYSATNTGRQEIYVREFPGAGPVVQISNSGGFWPRWRGDAKELFYVTLDHRVVSVSVQASSTFEWGPPTFLFRAPVLANSGAIGFITPFDVDRQGQRFLLTPLTFTDTPFTIVLNWAAVLTKE